MPESTTIIPIAGGKGGVGKSFVAANLAVALARRGYPTIVVDLDLGNSSLNGLLGLENRYPGIAEYLRLPENTERALADFVVPTPFAVLGFLPGDARMPLMANPTLRQRQRLLASIQKLQARYVVLDLSAGTGSHTLELFGLSDHGIVVTTPEHPAIMKMLFFLKNVMAREFREKFRRRKRLAEAVKALELQPVNEPVFTAEAFRNRLLELDPSAAEEVARICAQKRPRIIYNMVDSIEDTAIFPRVDRSLHDILSMRCDHFGLIPYDPEVRRSLRKPGLYWEQYPQSLTVQAIDRIAHRVVRFWDEPIAGSAELLARYGNELLLRRDLFS